MDKFHISGLDNNASVKTEKTLIGEVEIYTVTIEKGDVPIDLSNMRVSVFANASGAVGRWFPSAYQYQRGVKQTWSSFSNSSYVYNAPLYSYFDSDDTNLLTVAISDGFTSWEFQSGINEETRELEFTAHPCLSTADYIKFSMFVDRSKRPYFESIRDVADWWSSLNGKVRKIPECAYDPVYSTWYSFHRDIDIDKVLAECKVAAKIGCKTVFIDDGWATPHITQSFEHAGDWKPNREKFSDLQKLTNEIHTLGMKAVLWIAPGLCGYSSQTAKLYDGKFLYDNDGQRTHILDIRYPMIRSSLYRNMCDIITEYGFDGLKIDFIDSIHGPDCKPDAERDYTSVNNALRDMLTNTYNKLIELSPDNLIEFRQGYTGNDILQAANIVRSGDCAQDFLTNRINTIDLRLHTNVAVHSDMVQIIENEAPEKSAFQLTNILFSTPQISVRFDKISDDQLKMLKFFIGFMSEKRELLQKSSFEPSHCYSNYPSVTVRNKNERLTALYGENFLILDDVKNTTYIVNAYSSKPIYLGSDEPTSGKYHMLDCMGNTTERGNITMDKIPRPYKIPLNGIMIIEKYKIQRSSK